MTPTERTIAREAMRQTYRRLKGCAEDANRLALRMGARFEPIPGRLRHILRSHALAAIEAMRPKTAHELLIEAEVESLL